MKESVPQSLVCRCIISCVWLLSLQLRAQTLADALNTNLTWSTGGNVYICVPNGFGCDVQYLDPSWTVETNASLDGLGAQSAGPITSSDQESWVQTSTTNSGFLFFSWKANLSGWILAPSTHQGSKLELYLNGNLKQQLYWTTNWSAQVLYCDGATNTVRWRQAVDPGGPDTSQDKAWLDKAMFVSDPMAPQIWSQPLPNFQKVAEGSTVNISATAIGTPPLFYQWQQNGTNLPGATNATLTLSNVILAQSGTYALTVSNAINVTTSSNATLQVVAMMPLNKIAQWPGYERSATESVAVDGNRVYIGNDYWNTYGAFLVLDASDPVNPTLLGKLEGTQHGFNHLRVVGNYVYAGLDSGGGLDVIDVSNPAQPQLVTNLNLGTISDLQIVGNYAYAISYNLGLVILNITQPAQPTITSSNSPLCFAQGVSVVDHYAYVVGRCGGNLAVVDISSPTNPIVVGTVSTGGLGADKIAVTNNTAYVGTWNNMVVVDVGNPTNPVVVTTLSGYVTRFAGDKAYVSDGYNLSVLDISTPTNPVQIAAYDLSDYLENFQIVSNLVYIANWQNGLTIVDISNPAQPHILSTYAAGGESGGVDVSGNLAFLSDAKGGLQIFDVSNPVQPVPLGRYWTPSDDGTWQNRVVGNLDYVAYNSAGLRILDISDPTHPVLKGACTNVYAEWVDVSGNYAYVGSGGNGLQIVDVSDPTHPIQVVQTNVTVGVWLLKVSGDYLYLAPAYENNVMTVDISNPINPVAVSDVPFSGQTWNYFIQGNRLFGGGQIADISNPTNPVVTGQYFGWPGGYVECVSNIAFVADGNGLSAVDFSVPPSVQIGHTNLIGWSQALKIAGQYAFVADDDWGLQVFQLPTNFVAAPTLAPWPTNRIAFAGDNVSLAVNAAGQPPFSYQWFSNNVQIAGATNWVLIFTNLQPAAAGNYAVVVNNSAGAATNHTALTVMVQPNILTGGTNTFGFDASGNFRFAFQTQSGAQYAVEYLNSLRDTNWTVLTNIWGNDFPIQVMDPSPTNTSRFYRVRKE
jgi:hypothetical protein